MLTIGGETVLAIDTDAHVIETEQTWSYLQPREEKYRPLLVGSAKKASQEYWVVQDKIAGFRFPNQTAQELQELSQKTGRDMNTSTEARELAAVDQRLAHMDEVGIDIQVLHNTMWIEQVTNQAEAEVALCRSYNRWLGDIWERSHKRLRWSCLPPTLNLPAAVEEIRWSKAHGAAGVCMRPYEGERVLIDPYFYPVFEAAQESDLAITVHIANGSPSMVELLRPAPFFSRFRGQIPATVNSYLMSEIPDLFPRLRIGFIEASSQWLPWVLLSVTRSKGLKRTASADLLREKRVWVTCENDDDLGYVVSWAGEDSLITGTDYGHTDPASNVLALREFAERTDITDEVKKKIVRENARAYYGITDDQIPDYARGKLEALAAA